MSKPPHRRFDPDRHRRIVNDAIHQMKFVKDTKSSQHSPIDKLMHDVADVLATVHAAVRPILKAGGGFDEPAIKQIIWTHTNELLRRFSRDELEVLVCVTLCDAIMDDISANPTGSDKGPDLLSGGLGEKGIDVDVPPPNSPIE